MSIILLASAGNSPGVTTTSLGLALSWPRPVTLIDADRCPSQSVLAGHLAGVDPAGRGLPMILQAHREGRSLGEEFIHQGIVLNSPDDQIERRFIPGFSHPGMVQLFSSAWSELVVLMTASGQDSLVDLGRLGTTPIPTPLAHSIDLAIVVCRSSLVSLAALRLYLPSLADEVGQDRLGLLLVGEGQPYGRREIEQRFGVEVVGVVHFDRVAAGYLSDGGQPPRRHQELRLRRSYAEIAAALIGRQQRALALIGGLDEKAR